MTLTLQPAFLHQHFPYVRSRLVGERNQAHHAQQPDQANTAAARPVLKTRSTKVVMAIVAFFTLLSIGVLAVLFTPEFYYRIFPADTSPISSEESGTPLGGEFAAGPQTETPTEQINTLPPQDLTLPEGLWLTIPRIGVRTQPQATETEDEALQTGVWLVPDFGRPGDRTQPIIMAAHRFGWQWWWQTDYWQYHSFYKLPETEPGDIVEVMYDQRKFYYEIYAGEEGEEITDYSADLILYTCKFLNSPVRHFRYARLVDVNKDVLSSANMGK